MSDSFLLLEAAPAEIYPLSLHDALPISSRDPVRREPVDELPVLVSVEPVETTDRKSTRLNSSHVEISYAVFCLKKKISQDRKSTRLNNSHMSISYIVFFVSTKLNKLLK